MLLLGPGTAQAQSDLVTDCERAALAFAKKQGADLRGFRIDRGETLIENRYDDRVGSQMISTEILGTARAVTAGGEQRERFVCLHAGAGRGAVYVGRLPE